MQVQVSELSGKPNTSGRGVGVGSKKINEKKFSKMD
jgi:hypothetical protein